MNTNNTNKIVSALVILALMLGLLGVSRAFACNGGGNCENAPGQQTPVATETETPKVNPGGQTLPTQAVANGLPKVTVTSSAPLINNGGNTLPTQAVANGVASQPQNLIAGTDTETAAVDNGNGVPATGTTQEDVLSGQPVGPTGKPVYCTETTVNEPITDYNEFVRLARSWSRWWSPNGNTVSGWAHYVIPVWTEGPNGWVLTYTETSNSDNELVRGRGGWPNISTDLWEDYNDNLVHFANQVSCPTD